MSRLLLHICCAPCAIYPLKEELTPEFDTIEGFFYNPNIYPVEEYLARRKALEEFSRKENLTVHYPEYHPEELKKRCKACYRLRLEGTARFARENNFDSFSTTLLISPYQDQETIREIGEEAARKHKVDFYFSNFRRGFHQSQKEAKEMSLYRQKYCGCKYSKEERDAAR